MSDFGELCPLFNTGVYNEVFFPAVAMTNITASGNALAGTLTASLCGYFTFGRTVVVTDAAVRKTVNPTAGQSLALQHFTSGLAAGTTFGTCVVSITLTGMQVGYTWLWMTVTSATFTSNDVLGLTVGTSTASGAGNYELMVRYREK